MLGLIAGPHAAGSADVPASPFTVNSGRSSFTFPLPNLQQRLNNNFSFVILPIHASIQLQSNPLYPAHLIPLDIGDPNVITNLAAVSPALRQLLEDALRYNSMNFSGTITIRPLHPREVLVRCCQSDPAQDPTQQQARKEPGTWWTDVRDMPLSVSDIRSGLAIRPDWNQDGNLEFFVVPEDCDIIALEGLASSQCLIKNDHRFVKLLANTHYPNFPPPHPQFDFVDGQYLSGGINQIAIVGNFGDTHGNGITCPGFAFYRQAGHRGGPSGYMPCIAIIETGFDVEM
jgi:hypothetical protein